MPNNQYLMDESQIPENWVDVEAPKLTSPSAPPIRPDMPMFFSGSLPPNIQHDMSFVGTKAGSSRIPIHSLMPLGIQANPATNAGVQSTVIKQVNNNTGSNITLQTNGSNNPNQGVLDLEPGSSNVSLSSDTSGAVRISVAASGGFFTSRPDFKRWTLWAQNGGAGGIGGTGFTAVNDSIVNTQSGAITFTAVPPSSVDDFGFEQKITGGTGGNFSAITGSSGLIPQRDFSVFCPIRLSTATAHMRVWVVATDVAGGVGNLANNDVPGSTNIVGFRYSTTIGANWFAVVANAGTSQSEVDTGVPINSAVANMLRVDFDSASSTYTFFIDGLQVATLSTANNPSTTQPLLGFVSVACIGGVASTNAIRYSAFYTEMRTVVTTN